MLNLLSGDEDKDAILAVESVISSHSVILSKGVKFMVNRHMSTTTAKAHLSALIEEVAYRGEHVIIERRGQPMAAMIGMCDFVRLEEARPVSAQPRGALALLSVQHDLTDEEIDALVDDIYAQRVEG